MAITTKEDLFGNGFGVPGNAGWVPISLSTSTNDTSPYTGALGAANRGLNVADDITAANLNRTTYALALNDEELAAADAAMLIAYEAADVALHALVDAITLDAAYDRSADGAVVKGAGRIINKDAGAVETVSAYGEYVALYSEDITNAHFRANLLGNNHLGCGGFEAVSYGRNHGTSISGLRSAIFGMMDRRVLNFDNYSNITDTMTADLFGGGATLLGGRAFRDISTNTDIIIGYDMLEVLAGPNKGVYVITGLGSLAVCTVQGLDGVAPDFGTQSGVAVQICRPIFGTFNRFGHDVYALQYDQVSVAGVPGQESALDIIPGSLLGRYEASMASPDGSRYAMRVRNRSIFGGLGTALEIDAQGQVRSYVGNDQLAVAQIALWDNFGAAAFVTQQDDGGGHGVEVGYLARSNTEINTWIGVGTFGDARPYGTPAGEFTFTYEAGPFVMVLDNANATDQGVVPGVTLVEIYGDARAGIYQITSVDIGTGGLSVTRLDGVAIAGWPTDSSLGTCRLLFGCTLGARLYDVGGSLITTSNGGLHLTAQSGMAGAVLSAPRQDDSTALLLEASGINSAHEHWFVRGVRTDNGLTQEAFSVMSDGRLAAVSLEASTGDITTNAGDVIAAAGDIKATLGDIVATAGDIIASAGDLQATLGGCKVEGTFDYITDKAELIPVSIFDYNTATATTDTLNVLLPSAGDHYVQVMTDSAGLFFSLDPYLRDGMVIKNISIILHPGDDRAEGASIQARILKADVNFTGPGLATPVDVFGGSGYLFVIGATTPYLLTAAADISHTVVRSGANGCNYYLAIKFGNNASGDETHDKLYGIQLHVTDPGPRNV